MKLTELQITHLRNISSARLSFHSHINIISGINGSGKTSFLEAIYLLGSGHSFRVREIGAMVSHAQETLVVFGKTDSDQRVSIQKSIHFSTKARLDGQPCLASSELAAFLPCQIFYQDIFQLIDGGPALRRGLLDWGLFHSVPGYHLLWKDYRRLLKQRNSLLKQRPTLQELAPWNSALNDIALPLDAMRYEYFQRLLLEFQVIIQQLTEMDCRLDYYRGWDKKNEGKSLLDSLNASHDMDSARQFTRYGPHQADLAVICKGFSIKQALSRGQQKMVLFALKFAQAKLLTKPCIYLIDDLTSELDSCHIKRLTEFIKTIDGQFFITLRENDLSEVVFPEQYHFSLAKGLFTQCK